MFYFNSQSATVFEQQQIQFGALMSGPEICLIGLQLAEHLFHCITLPRSANSWMRKQLLLCTNPQQDVKQAAVANVNFGRFDLTFIEILVPRLKLPHGQQTCEEIQIPPHRRFPDAQ